jgi:hypothetical protein
LLRTTAQYVIWNDPNPDAIGNDCNINTVANGCNMDEVENDSNTTSLITAETRPVFGNCKTTSLRRVAK